MDEIKTNFDKIMEQFSESIPNAAVPRKLNYESLGDTFQTCLPKKRKMENNDTSKDDSLTGNTSRDSMNNSLTASPWEARRMKADLLEARARISKLKMEVEQQQKVRSEVEILYNSKVKELKKQCEFSSNKVLDVEKHLKLLRKRETAAKTEVIKLKNDINQQKQTYEDTIYNLQRSNSELEENFDVMQNRLTNEINDYKRRTEKLQMDFSLTVEELENVKAQMEEWQDKANAYEEVSTQLEEEKQDHENTKSKLKQLEYEIAAFGDWKEISKISTSRLANMPDIERELERLNKENKSLRENIGNKMLLEEQVFDLKSRLEKNEINTNESANLAMRVKTLESEIQNWLNVAKDHCTPNMPLNPTSLRARIEVILQKDLVMTSEKGYSKAEKDTFQSQIRELKTQNEIYTKANNDLKIALKHRENIMMRAKKKLLMVAKERDCYKQLVENFEKDLTISGALVEAMNPDAQLRSRLELVEKSLTAYKDLCSNLERELEAMKPFPDVPVIDAQTMESYDRLKKEIENLRIENDRLKRRKDELELEMEHRCLKGDFNVNNYKVVHLAMNPASEAYENSKNELEKLQAEIERLKRRNRKLEQDQEELTRINNETSNITVNVKEVNTLRSKIESMESKMQHMKEVYKSASLEFREVCYMLFGYRIDRVGNANYRISSMYAESENEYLNFRINENGILDMLETEYSVTLSDMMSSHLETHKSLPAFLSSLTLELFNRTTLMV